MFKVLKWKRDIYCKRKVNIFLFCIVTQYLYGNDMKNICYKFSIIYDGNIFVLI